jgi:ribosome-associated protein
LGDSRITTDGVVVIKAKIPHSGAQPVDGLQRLNALVATVARPPRPRKPTKPTWGSQQRRLQGKTCAPASRHCAAGCMTELV